MIQNRIFVMSSGRNIFQRLLGLISLLLVVGLLFYLFYHVYRLLYFLSPVFLLIAVVLYHKVIIHHIKVIQRSFQYSFIGGILTVGLQIIALPMVAIGLIFKAWAFRKFGTFKDDLGSIPANESYSEYEEVVEKKETPPQAEIRRKESEKLLSTYDDLFE